MDDSKATCPDAGIGAWVNEKKFYSACGEITLGSVAWLRNNTGYIG